MSSLSIRLGLRALLVVALHSCWLSARPRAVTSNWNIDASGSSTTAANCPSGVPDSDDTTMGLLVLAAAALRIGRRNTS